MSCFSRVGEMDALSSEGIHADMPKTELVAKVSRLPVERIQRIRTALFDEAKKVNLALPEDVLVGRQKRANGKPLWEKLADDVCTVLSCISNNDHIPRQLLRNGKRSAAEFEAPRKKHKPSNESSQGAARDVLVDVPMTNPANNGVCTQESDTPTLMPASNSFIQSDPTFNSLNYVANTALMSETNLLKEGVAELKVKILHLQNEKTREALLTDTCHLYVRLQNMTLEQTSGKQMLETALKCPVVCYTCIRQTPILTFKVKILKSYLYIALSAVSREKGHIVRLWKSQQEPFAANNDDLFLHKADNSASPGKKIGITTWNCRGEETSQPYIRNLMDNGSDVIILSEHWLWPFEMHKLKEINPEFDAECVTDSRLNETSSLTRGCGGVGILWKKSFDVTPIGEIDSDRICGIRMRLTYPETKELTILGVYSPCADAGIEKYVQVLCELERLISEGQRLGPVLLGGDFNAHLGALGGVRGTGEPNQQGVLLADLLDRCEMYAPSLSSIAKGPSYTYRRSSEVRTTVDYVLADCM